MGITRLFSEIFGGSGWLAINDNISTTSKKKVVVIPVVRKRSTGRKTNTKKKKKKYAQNATQRARTWPGGVATYQYALGRMGSSFIRSQGTGRSVVGVFANFFSTLFVMELSYHSFAFSLSLVAWLARRDDSSR